MLGGITRKVVLEIAEASGMTIEERLVHTSELATADEVFITSSFKDIVPITKVDEMTIGSGEVGSLTKDLATQFAALTTI
jgi:branched-subunit amino acid aminotransferase/4-amino-4-deoxychorismate lyase